MHADTECQKEEPTLLDDIPTLTNLVACPECDTLHLSSASPTLGHAHCQRCGSFMKTTRLPAFSHILSLALTALILMFVAVNFTFLELDVQGHHNSISVIQAVMAFDSGITLIMSLAVAGFIIVVPLTRLIAIIYSIGPLAFNSPIQRGAKKAFRLAETLRPWSMAEIFIVGVSVAMIKLTSMATVTVGPAFWAFVGLVVITVLKDQLICKFSIWQALE